MSSPDLPQCRYPTSPDSDRQAVRLVSITPMRDYRSASTPGKSNTGSDPAPCEAESGTARSLELDPHALAAKRECKSSRQPSRRGSEPLALAYAGHQFGYFVPQLGDGRANLLGEVMGRDGVHYDIQLKGSGRLPSPPWRRQEPRSVRVLREYIVSEAMAALGVPTTRALAAVTTGERVFRETTLPGAVLTRSRRSPPRGHLPVFRAQGDTEGIRRLADYAIARHYPDVAGKSGHIGHCWMA